MTTTVSAPVHGGDIQRVSAEYGIPATDLLDFSANINPRGLPLRAQQRLEREAADSILLMQYPDPEACGLRQALSERLDVPIESIIVAGGAGELISASVRAFQAQSCVIPVPAFCEYERDCVVAGCSVYPLPLDPEANFVLNLDALLCLMNSKPSDLLIVNNPHNPSGALNDRKAMRRLLDAAGDAQVNVLVDEAFIDYAPNAGITAEAARRPAVIAVRSLTKFYGCPALRVGYAVTSPAMAARLAAQLPAWPVTTLALNALCEALCDTQYAHATLEENERERTRLSLAFGKLGFRVFPSAANFLLLRLPNKFSSAHIRERLIRERCILVRNCDSFHGLEPDRYIRVAVRSERDNKILTEAVSDIIGK